MSYSQETIDDLHQKIEEQRAEIKRLEDWKNQLEKQLCACMTDAEEARAEVERLTEDNVVFQDEALAVTIKAGRYREALEKIRSVSIWPCRCSQTAKETLNNS